MTRTALEWARQVARTYRDALMDVAPSLCESLDKLAADAGQRWLLPAAVPADAVAGWLDAELPAADVAHWTGVPTSTIRSWERRGMLTRRTAADGSPLYRVGDVVDVEARNRQNRTGDT